MRSRLPVVAFLGAASVFGTASAQPAVGWRMYKDSLYGIVLDIPNTLAQKRKEAGRLELTSPDRTFYGLVSATDEIREGFPGNDPDGDIAPTDADCDRLPPSYRVAKPHLAAFSCTKRDKIVYEVAKYTRSGSITLRFEYPANQNARWKPVVSRMSATLRRTR
jgi:hypothetical protein